MVKDQRLAVINQWPVLVCSAVALTNLLEWLLLLLMSLHETTKLVLTTLKIDLKINFTMDFWRLHNCETTHDKVTWESLSVLNWKLCWA